MALEKAFMVSSPQKGLGGDGKGERDLSPLPEGGAGVEGSAQAECTLSEVGKPIMPGGGFGRLKPFAVVADQERHGVVDEKQLHNNRLCLGMLGDIGEGFLKHPKERQLCRGRERFFDAVFFELNAEARSLREGLRIVAQVLC
jgi:hypothetical protein